MSVAATSSARQRQVLAGCAIAALFWAASGVAALFSPTGDVGDIGSVWFYVIESTHAVAETGMVIALLALWRGLPWRGRSANAAFVVAIGATALLAFLTYLVVGVTAAGAPVEVFEVVLTLFFLLSVIGTLIGFVWLGIVVILSAPLPAAVGWLLLAHPLLMGALLSMYAMGIAVGVAWAAIGWLATRGWTAEQT